MKLLDHISSAFDDEALGKKEAALLHACIAIDATSRKLFEKASGRNQYKSCLREYWWILEPMIGGGLNLQETKFTNLKLFDGKKRIAEPDLADFIYHVYRCGHAHGEEVPIRYSLTPSRVGRYEWRLADDQLCVPDTLIWGLLAISVFCRANADLVGGEQMHLTWGPDPIDHSIYQFFLKDWWGREDDFRAFIVPRNSLRVKLGDLGGAWGSRHPEGV